MRVPTPVELRSQDNDEPLTVGYTPDHMCMAPGGPYLKPGARTPFHRLWAPVLCLGVPSWWWLVGTSMIVARAARTVSSPWNASPELCPETEVRAVSWGHELLIGCRAIEPFY